MLAGLAPPAGFAAPVSFGVQRFLACAHRGGLVAAGVGAWIHDDVAGRRWRISAGSFFQTPDWQTFANELKGVQGRWPLRSLARVGKVAAKLGLSNR